MVLETIQFLILRGPTLPTLPCTTFKNRHCPPLFHESVIPQCKVSPPIHLAAVRPVARRTPFCGETSAGRHPQQFRMESQVQERDYHNCMWETQGRANSKVCGWCRRNQICLDHDFPWSSHLPTFRKHDEPALRLGRYTVVRNQCSPLTDAVRTREIQFAMDSIRNWSHWPCDQYLGSVSCV